MEKYKKGRVVSGVVSGIEPYGIFVKFDEDYNGLIHISEISHNYVKKVDDLYNIGDEIKAEIVDVDKEHFKLKLSLKNINNNNFKRRKIKETSLGFTTLQYNLPYWIQKNIKSYKKHNNNIDKQIYK